MPPKIANELSTAARDIAVDNLRIAIESRDLHAALTEAGVSTLFLKGLTLGGLAYGDPLLKMGWDIDLLIEPSKLEQAAAVMAARGYRLVVPSVPERLQSWHRSRKDSHWSNNQGLHVELHTRLTENGRLIPTMDVHAPQREVEVAPNVSLPTLDRDELFAYLCVHGATSLWFRLKWITDLAAILHNVDQTEIARLHVRAQELGAGRASGAALLLADALYGTLGGSALRLKLTRERADRWLYEASLRQLIARSEPREPTSAVGGTAAIHLSQLLLLPGASFKFGEVLRQLHAALTQRLSSPAAIAGVPLRRATGAASNVHEFRS